MAHHFSWNDLNPINAFKQLQAQTGRASNSVQNHLPNWIPNWGKNIIGTAATGGTPVSDYYGMKAGGNDSATARNHLWQHAAIGAAAYGGAAYGLPYLSSLTSGEGAAAGGAAGGTSGAATAGESAATAAPASSAASYARMGAGLMNMGGQKQAPVQQQAPPIARQPDFQADPNKIQMLIEALKRADQENGDGSLYVS